MTEALTQTISNDEELSFAELFEMEENSSVVNVGDVTMGTITGVVDGYVLADVGVNAESYVAKSELQLEKGKEIETGATLEVFIERRKDAGGLL